MKQNNFGFSVDFGSGMKKLKKDTRRAFTKTQKNEIWAQQDGLCAGSSCGHKRLDPRTVEYHHGRAWSNGGKTMVKNGQALCSECHKLKHHRQRLKKVETRTSQKQTKNPSSAVDAYLKRVQKSQDNLLKRMIGK